MVFKRKVYPPKHGLDLIGSSPSLLGLPSIVRRAVWPSSSSRRKLADGARRHPLSQLRRVWGYMLTSYVMLSTKSLGRGARGEEGRETSFLRADKRMDALKKQGYIRKDWKKERKTRERVNEGLRVRTSTYVRTSIRVATRKRRQRPSKRNARSTFLLFFLPSSLLNTPHCQSRLWQLASRDFRPTYPTNNEIPMTHVLGHVRMYVHGYIIYLFLSLLYPFVSFFTFRQP